MRFHEALENMIYGRRVCLPVSTYFKYIYFDKVDQCFKYNNGDVFIINENVIPDRWELYKEEPKDYSRDFIVRQGLVKEITDVYKGVRTVNYTVFEDGINKRVANDSIELLCDSKGFSLKTGRNHAFKESTFKNKGYINKEIQ